MLYKSVVNRRSTMQKAVGAMCKKKTFAPAAGLLFALEAQSLGECPWRRRRSAAAFLLHVGKQ